MRALSEQPRVATAKLLLGLTLIGMGTAAGALLDGQDGDRVQVSEPRFAVAQRSVTGMKAELGGARERIARAETALDRARHDARKLARSNRQLRRELRAAQRARRQARRQR
jgi:chromosome segregation ATPase